MNKQITIDEAIQELTPISLKEMDTIALMDRVDSKFVFPAIYLPSILESCKNQYKVLEINSIKKHQYDSLYFDDATLNLYHKHHGQRLNRYKIRYRKYVNSNGLTFFEVKFKNNKARTIKTRMKVNDINPILNNQCKIFLSENSNLNVDMLIPTLNVQYDRITLVSNKLNERITLDLNLTYEVKGKSQQFQNVVIAEVKRNKVSEITDFIRVLRRFKIREGGSSKYCLGIALLYNDVKKNNFKPNISLFNKINQIKN